MIMPGIEKAVDHISLISYQSSAILLPLSQARGDKVTSKQILYIILYQCKAILSEAAADCLNK